MKKILYIIAIFSSLQGAAQDVSYADSTITLTLTQRCAYWVGAHIKNRFEWAERNAPDAVGKYIGSGNNPDSVFSVVFKAKYLLGALESLIAQPLQVAYADYRSIVMNQPAIPGYTALATQINVKAAANGNEKNVATWLKEQYERRVGDFNAVYNEQKQQTVNWSKN